MNRFIRSPIKNILFRRNQDLQEITFSKNEDTLRFAVVNGFRNIQNIVQKLKRNRNPYDFIEVMACPSGEDII